MLCLFCLKRQKHLWNNFAFNQLYLAKGKTAPVILLPNEAKQKYMILNLRIRTGSDWWFSKIFQFRNGSDSISSDQDWTRTEKFHSPLISDKQVSNPSLNELEVAEVTFSELISFLFQNFWIRVWQFFKFEKTTPIQTPATNEVAENYQWFYFRNDHADTCNWRNWKVTPGPDFHMFLTPSQKEKRRILPESTPSLWIRGHLWPEHVVTSAVVLRWLCDSPRAGRARRTTIYVCCTYKQ